MYSAHYRHDLYCSQNNRSSSSDPSRSLSLAEAPNLRFPENLPVIRRQLDGWQSLTHDNQSGINSEWNEENPGENPNFSRDDSAHFSLNLSFISHSSRLPQPLLRGLHELHPQRRWLVAHGGRVRLDLLLADGERPLSHLFDVSFTGYFEVSRLAGHPYYKGRSKFSSILH